MTLARITAFIGLTAAAAALRANAYELNNWPVYVLQKDATGETLSWEGAGPLLPLRARPAPERGIVEGLRPFYVTGRGGDYEKTDILYPLFYFRRYPYATKWSILQLINGDSGDPADPACRASPWCAVSTSGRSISPAKPATRRTATTPRLPSMGRSNTGWDSQRSPGSFFPSTSTPSSQTPTSPTPPSPSCGNTMATKTASLSGRSSARPAAPGESSHAFYLWPLIWDNVVDAGQDAPAGTAPGTQIGVLPLFTRETAPGFLTRTSSGPSSATRERTSPYRYSERRYFWPFLVQGRGDDRLLERCAPFYTYSNTKGADSRWVVWPLWHRTTWADSDLGQAEDPVLLFCLLVAGAAQPVPARAGPPLQDPLLAPAFRLGQRRRKPPDPVPEPP